MNGEKSVLQTLVEDTLDYIMHINIDSPSLDNLNTEKVVSDWIESAATCRTETHEEADVNVIVL